MNPIARTAAGAALAVATASAVLVPVLGGPAQAAAPSPCTDRDVVASYRPTDSGAGHSYGRLVLRNTGTVSCTVHGYGGLSFVGGGDGTQIGAAATREAAHVPTVILAPGERAVSRVSITQALNYPRRACRPRPVDGFRVYVPDATAAQFVPLPDGYRGCADADVRLLSHGPFRAR
ncbi:DUF4232 domain-containing protein [Nocardioides sp.]|uniref:DUF4232 domain-containing protein n=1 Tax=Nocardioides sp. TaxID=35761 RepID=UPI003513244A